MDQAERLLEAVLANPQDIGALQRYREATIRAGNPAAIARAEILDAQCSLSCKPAHDVYGVGIREESAFKALADEWFGNHLSFIDHWWSFDTGIEVSVAHYLAMDEAKLPRAPIQAIYLCSKGYFAEEEDEAEKNEQLSEYLQLAARSSLRYWLSLTLVEKGIPAACFIELITSPHLVHLRRLYVFDCPLGDESVLAMAGARNLSSLRHLCLNSLGDHGEPSDQALFALAQSEHVSQLESLYLQGGFSTTGIEALAASANIGKLRALHLCGRLNGSSVRALTSARMPDLTELSLGWFNQAMEEEGLMALIEWPQLAKIKSLGLGATAITAQGLRILATDPQVTSLEKLDLSYNCMLDDTGLSALAESPYLGKINELNLWGTAPYTPALRKRLVDRFGDRVKLPPDV